MENEKVNAVLVNEKAIPIREQRQMERLELEIKELEAEKAYYIKENEFLKQALQRVVGV